MGVALRGYLEPIANWFAGFNLPEPIVHWGHPVMMAIVVFVMGGFAAYAGWQGRLATDTGVAVEQKQNHAKIGTADVFVYCAGRDWRRFVFGDAGVNRF